MAKGVNRVILIGNLGQAPEMRYMPSGGAVASFSIAVSESWKDKQTGENKERTEWINISVFGKLAEICGKYLKKGSKVYIEGQLRTEKYQDKQTGADRYSTKIVAREMQMLDSRDGSQADEHRQAPSQQAQPRPQGHDVTFDDDIPF